MFFVGHSLRATGANFFINAGGSVDALMVEGCWTSLNAVREYWRESNFRIRQAGAFISHSFDSHIKCPVAPVASHECTSSDSDSCASDLPKKKLRSSSAPFVIYMLAKHMLLHKLIQNRRRMIRNLGKSARRNPAHIRNIRNSTKKTKHV